MSTEKEETDYSFNNPETLTKYRTAGEISQKALAFVSKLCTEGAKIVDICTKGDKFLEEEISKVYKANKKLSKGIGHATTVSPSSFVTPYTPLTSDTEEAETVLKPYEVVKVQLGAQIDGFCTIVCNSIVVPGSRKDSDIPPNRQADLLLATYYANEVLLRLMIPPGTLTQGSEEDRKKAALEKAPSQAKITQLLEKVVKSFNCNLTEGTTSWLFEHNEIEGKKKIILAPGEGMKGDGVPETSEVWGVEMGVSLGAGKVKDLEKRATLHRRTAVTYQLKRPSSRTILSEIVSKFKTFPFSLRQLEDERAAKVGVVESVRCGVLRQYNVAGDKDNEPVGRLLTTVAITKNGITLLAAPPKPDLAQLSTEKKIRDEEILKILERPLARNTGSKSKNKKKKKKPAKKAAAAVQNDDDDEDDDDEDEDSDDE